MSQMSLLEEWQPDGLVAPLDLALTLADQKVRNLWRLSSLSTALVVLTSTDDSPLADHHRDLLWHAFGVPIFEHLAAQDGTILARECEVHEGLHVCLEAPLAFEAEFDCDPCPCGLETPRLVSRVPISVSGGCVQKIV